MSSIRFSIVYKTYVISLAKSGSGQHQSVAKVKLSRTLGFAKKFGWDLEVFDAIDGYTMNESIWQEYGLQIPKKSNGKGKFGDKPGALGCFLSHYILWNKCVDTNQPIVVLEDDANILSPMITISTNLDVVKLHAPRACKEHDTLGRWSPGAFGYWLSTSGAKKMIDHCKSAGPKYNDKLIASNILDWGYINTPVISLREKQGSSTNPEKYPYPQGLQEHSRN
jgi:hypothetical protein